MAPLASICISVLVVAVCGQRLAPIILYSGHTQSVGGIAITANASRFVSVGPKANGSQLTVMLWELQSGALLQQLVLQSSVGTSQVACSRSNASLCAVFVTVDLFVINLDLASSRRVSLQNVPTLTGVQFHPVDPTEFLISGRDNTVQVLNAATAAVVLTLGVSVLPVPPYTAGVLTARYHPTNPNLILASYKNGSLLMWDRAAGKVILNYTYPPNHTYADTSLVFAHSGDWFVASSAVSPLSLWNTTTATLTRYGGAHVLSVSMELSPDDTLLVYAANDGLGIYNVSGARQEVVDAYAGDVSPTAVAFDPTNSSRFLAGFSDSALRLYEYSTRAYSYNYHATATATPASPAPTTAPRRATLTPLIPVPPPPALPSVPPTTPATDTREYPSKDFPTSLIGVITAGAVLAVLAALVLMRSRGKLRGFEARVFGAGISPREELPLAAEETDTANGTASNSADGEEEPGDFTLHEHEESHQSIITTE